MMIGLIIVLVKGQCKRRLLQIFRCSFRFSGQFLFSGLNIHPFRYSSCYILTFHIHFLQKNKRFVFFNNFSVLEKFIHR